MSATIIRGDARQLPLPDESVDLICTSPPYFGLRDYRDGDESLTGQIGAEATPAEYVAALLECTREWMRVLKPEGSLWVNLGDSYSSGQRLDDEFTVEDAAWLAGVVDSDGSISIHKQGTSYTAWVRVGQTRPEVVQRIHRVTGIGRICKDSRGCWHWQAAAQQAARVLERIWPWLQIKRRQALAGVELQARKEAVGGKGRWNRLTDAEIGHRERIRQAVLAWNRGEPDDHESPVVPLPVLPSRARWIPQKSLMLLPERYTLGCIDDLGLILRAEVIWSKSNGLPESVTDRVRRSHEQWFHFVKQQRYFSAVDEIREPHTRVDAPRRLGTSNQTQRHAAATDNTGWKDSLVAHHPLGKLPGSVWEFATQPLKVPAHLEVDHFAAFPPSMIRRIVLGWSPFGICAECGEGRRPASERSVQGAAPTRRIPGVGRDPYSRHGEAEAGSTLRGVHQTQITGYACGCPTPDAATRAPVVLDPFGGTGTTALVASVFGRRGISVDMSADYCRLAAWRTTDPGERARALGVPKPPKPMEGQGDLFEVAS